MDPIKEQEARQAAGMGMGQPDLSKATPIKCEHKYTDLEKGVQLECGGEIFQPGVELKRLSALVSPNGQVSCIPVQIFYCVKCGTRYPLETLK
tara:strand:+ start:606 stop:884 length:279 start_codon:yes stop_codon:yes gene_type:complete